MLPRSFFLNEHDKGIVVWFVLGKQNDKQKIYINFCRQTELKSPDRPPSVSGFLAPEKYFATI